MGYSPLVKKRSGVVCGGLAMIGRSGSLAASPRAAGAAREDRGVAGLSSCLSTVRPHLVEAPAWGAVLNSRG